MLRVIEKRVIFLTVDVEKKTRGINSIKGKTYTDSDSVKVFTENIKKMQKEDRGSMKQTTKETCAFV